MSLAKFKQLRKELFQVEKSLYSAEIWGEFDEDGDRAESTADCFISEPNQTEHEPRMVVVAENLNALLAYCKRFEDTEWIISTNGEWYISGYGQKWEYYKP